MTEEERLKQESLKKVIAAEANDIKNAPRIVSSPGGFFRCHFCGAVRPSHEAHPVHAPRLPGGKASGSPRLAGRCCIPGRVGAYGD